MTTASKELSADAKEAMEYVGEIIAVVGEGDQWAQNEAVESFLRISNEWGNLCRDSETISSPSFIEQGKRIIEKFTAYQKEIARRNQTVADFSNDRIPIIQELIQDEEEKKAIMGILERLFKHWNNIIRPHLAYLLNKSIEVEMSIWDTLEKGINMHKPYSSVHHKQKESVQ